MPSERYIPPSAAQLRKLAEEREAKEKFNGMRRRLIEAALRKLKKDELIEVMMSLDTYDPSVRWSIESAINLRKPPDLVAHDLRDAIAIATRVDKFKMNTNFSYSWQAYEETARGFAALVRLGELELAKAIAIDFMREASYQMACSDEGRMLEEIQTCLEPVLQAIEADEPQLHRDWAIEMTQADEIGVICSAALVKIALGRNSSP